MFALFLLIFLDQNLSELVVLNVFGHPGQIVQQGVDRIQRFGLGFQPHSFGSPATAGIALLEIAQIDFRYGFRPLLSSLLGFCIALIVFVQHLPTGSRGAMTAATELPPADLDG